MKAKCEAKLKIQMLAKTFLYQTPVKLETFIRLDWRKNILATKLKMFLFHTSKIDRPILSFGSDGGSSVAQSQSTFEN